MAKAPQNDPTVSDKSLEPADSTSQEFIRAANEDDDGYDPYSDRPPLREDMYEEDPWR